MAAPISKDTAVSIGMATMLVLAVLWVNSGIQGAKDVVGEAKVAISDLAHEVKLLRIQVEANAKGVPFRSWVRIFRAANKEGAIVIPPVDG